MSDNLTMLNICGTDIRVEGRLVRVARLEADKYEFLEDPSQLLDGLRKSRTRIDLFTFMQGLTDNSPKYNYPMEWDNLAVLPVSTFEHWWKHQIRSFPRNRARQAEKKGVVVREVAFDESLVQGIWGIYNECPIRQGKPFLHYGMSIEAVRKHAGTFLDTSIFIGAFLGEQLIGFAKLTSDQARTQANFMNIVSMVEHKEKAPTNALIAQAVRSCADRNIRHLVYQNFCYGNKPPDSLSKFKENNGFKRVDLPRYYVPLTLIGWAALRLGLHHRVADHLPAPLADKLRAFRSAWYNRRLQAVTKDERSDVCPGSSDS